MKANVFALRKESNEGSVAPVTQTNGLGTIILAMNAALRSKFGRKTWAYLALIIKVEERTAKHRLAGTRPYDFLDAVNLLRSEIGFFILKAMMGNDPKKWPAWFKICVQQIKAAKLMTDMRQMHLLLEQSKAETADAAAKFAEDE